MVRNVDNERCSDSHESEDANTKRVTSVRHQTQPTVEDDDANTGDENNDVDVNIFYTDAKRKKD